MRWRGIPVSRTRCNSWKGEDGKDRERELEGGKRQLINGRGGRARGERGSRRERVDRGCSDRSLRSARSLALFSVPPHVETAWGVDGVCARCRESTLKLCPHQPLRQERITQPRRSLQPHGAFAAAGSKKRDVAGPRSESDLSTRHFYSHFASVPHKWSNFAWYSGRAQL